MNNEDLEKLAVLARLKIADEERETLKNSLNEILAFVEHLNSAEIEGIEPLSHPLDMYQRMRIDVVEEDDESEQLQALAPESDNDCYTVPKVID